MSKRKRRKKAKSRKKLAYGVAIVVLILIFLAYLSLDQPNPTSQPKAAIVDHLSRKEPNQEFVQNSTSVLEKAGFYVDYHGWEKLTDTNFYKILFKKSYDLFVLRVHSAITLIDGEETVAFFSWERYSNDTAGTKYGDDVTYDRLVQAFFQNEPNVRYFGITHKFVEKYGDFQDTIIVMMGCNGLTYTSMAEAFRRKGAIVSIGWDGLVSGPHTDQATTCLLQHLVQRSTIGKAVEETMSEVGPEKMYFQDQGYNSTMKYHPEAAGSHTIKYVLGVSGMDTIRANIVLVKEERKESD